MFKEFFIHQVLLVNIGFCIHFSAGVTDVVPKDRLVFVGETLKMVCTLDSSSDMNSVQFRILNERKQAWSLPEEEYFIDGLSVTANVTVNDSFTAFTRVECWENENFLNNTLVFVERPIPKIPNVSVVYLYQEHISLSWPWTMQNLSKIIIKVFWSASNTSNKNFINDCHMRGLNNCRIPFEDYKGLDPMNVTLNFSLGLWKNRPSVDEFKPLYDTNVTYSYTVYVLNKTKSGPPENLAIISKNQTCFELSWKNPVYLMDCSTCEKFYLIDVQREKAESSLYKSLQENNFGKPFKHSSLVKCNLQAFTKYEVNLQVKGGKPNPWSDPAYISITTDEDRPLSGPLLNSTNYYIKDCFSGKRLLYIYWKEPPIDQVQGILTKYQVVLNNNETYTVNKGSSYFKKDIQCHLDYNVSVFSVNSVNRSLSPSVIWIPGEHSDYSQELQLKVEEIYNVSISSYLKNVTVTWENVSLENVNLVIYRCEEDYQQNFCLSEYTSMEVSLSSMSVSINNIDNKENLFGFALKSENGVKQGIFWSGCIFKKEKEPEKPVGVQVNTGHDGHSLVISWVPEPCNKISKAFIQFYNICISDKEGNIIKWILKNGFENNHTVESLPSNKEYIVTIQGVTPYNLTGHFSDQVNVRPRIKINDSSWIEFNLPIVFSFVFIFIVLVGGYHLYVLCKTSHKTFKSLITISIRGCEDEFFQKPPFCNGTVMGYSQEINKDNCIQVNNNLTPPSINGSPPNETHNERIECVNNADVSSEENPQDRSDEGVDDLSGLNQQDYSKSGIEASETVSDDSPNSTCVSRSKKTFVTSHKLKRSLEEQPMLEESQNKLTCYVFSPFQKRGESVQNADIFSEELPHYSSVFVVDTSVCIGDNTAVIADDDTSFNSVRDTSIYIADNTEVISDDDTAVNSVVDTSGSIQQGYDTSGYIQLGYVTYTNAIGSIDSPCADFSPPCPSLSGSKENLLVNTPLNDKQGLQRIC